MLVKSPWHGTVCDTNHDCVFNCVNGVHANGGTSDAFGDKDDVVALQEADKTKDPISAQAFCITDFIHKLADLLTVELFWVLVDTQVLDTGAVDFQDTEAGLFVVAAD